MRREVAIVIEERGDGDSRDEGDSEDMVYSSTEGSGNELGSPGGEIDVSFPEFGFHIVLLQNGK